MDYNSNRKTLALPEYGRHIQKMVDHALSIEDREERMKCAKTIIGIMGNMFPHLRDINDFKHKLWDHLAIMADFKLDIDFPYDVPEPESLHSRPEKVPYRNSRIAFMHYGELVQQMIVKAIEMEEEDQKQHLTMLIAAHMKKSLHQWNSDAASDDKVINDLSRLSKGKLVLAEDTKLPEIKDNYPTRTRNNKKRNPKRNNDKK